MSYYFKRINKFNIDKLPKRSLTYFAYLFILHTCTLVTTVLLTFLLITILIISSYLHYSNAILLLELNGRVYFFKFCYQF